MLCPKQIFYPWIILERLHRLVDPRQQQQQQICWISEAALATVAATTLAAIRPPPFQFKLHKQQTFCLVRLRQLLWIPFIK